VIFGISSHASKKIFISPYDTIYHCWKEGKIPIKMV
jgi:hypothetical protein